MNGYRFTRRFFREGPDNDRSLGFLIIDRLSDTRAVCRRTAEVLLRLSATPEFAKYLEKDRLSITVLAVTEDRQKELRRCIRGYLNQVLGAQPFPWPRKNGYYQWPVRVEYVPKLLSYLPGRDAPKSPSSK